MPWPAAGSHLIRITFRNTYLDASIDYGIGKSWGGKVPFAPRVMTVLSASGEVVRASNNGPWRISRPNWARTAAWLGEEVEARSEAEGLRDLVEMWLRAFGPGTEATSSGGSALRSEGSGPP